ncbi:hypothetical protein CEXT_691321 [Caerostris extrusa]|uniref:Uncharacterized protein n=1 Tax=Caerostris extrusa TaxID=172846 RepID=A0AAV4XBW6_CAEEX|nr:hypothetical protein CEXT_691321 [Caerostris extrusa]
MIWAKNFRGGMINLLGLKESFNFGRCKWVDYVLLAEGAEPTTSTAQCAWAKRPYAVLLSNIRVRSISSVGANKEMTSIQRIILTQRT